MRRAAQLAQRVRLSAPSMTGAPWRWQAQRVGTAPETAAQCSRPRWQLTATPMTASARPRDLLCSAASARRHATSQAGGAAAMQWSRTAAALEKGFEVVPEELANDWFRFTSRPHEYWDHRDVKKSASAPDFTHQHDVRCALWLGSAPAWGQRLVSEIDRRPDTSDRPCRVTRAAGERQSAVARAAARLRNPEEFRQWQPRPEGPSGEALLASGWWRFLSAPETYYDHRRPAAQAQTAQSSAAGDGSADALSTAGSSTVGHRKDAGSDGVAIAAASRTAGGGRCDFSHQHDAGDRLSLSEAPLWVRRRVAALERDPHAPKPVPAPDAGASQHATAAAAAAAAMRRFRTQPEAHQDFRALKARGYKPAWYPDVVHSSTRAALWLDVGGGLARWQQDWGASEAATRRAERPQANGWFRFLQRPHEYFDYRSAKKRSSFPDFRHQLNQWDALWLEDAPQWAAEAVAARDMESASSGKPVKVRTPEEKAAARWAAFLQDPNAWLDQRPAKAAGRLSARHPDFVHASDRRRALWLGGAATPPEVHKVLTLRSLRPQEPPDPAPR